MNKEEAIYNYALRIADDTLIIGHRVSEWCGKGPILEEDIALTNISLDLIGQATLLFEYLAEFNNDGKTSDDIAFIRHANEYKNVLLCEQPNGDFGQTIVRQFLYSSFAQILYRELTKSSNERLAAIAEKSLKEVKYHVKHAAEWMIRLGDGTEESHRRVKESLEHLWKYKDELFYTDQVDDLLIAEGIVPNMKDFQEEYNAFVQQILSEATLEVPTHGWKQNGGRTGVHTEHLGFILAELQYMQRAYPNMEW
ncbi:MAG: 1,2-phenylacetyl-CoA epoxidase subunit PaaC [Lishizhenia sp.]